LIFDRSPALVTQQPWVGFGSRVEKRPQMSRFTFKKPFHF
jgi:hypothetical protein